MSSGIARRMGALLSVAAAAATVGAQQPRQLTDADYARAESFMNYNVNPLVYHGVEKPQWLGDGRFWYRDRGPDGTTLMLVDPAKKTKAAAFDQAKIAKALNTAMAADAGVTARSRTIAAKSLPVEEMEFSDGDKVVTLTTGARRWRCQLSSDVTCAAEGAKPSAAHDAPFELSPDGKKAAFLRDWNLWVRDVATGAETQLTTDGVKDYGYATDNAGWSSSDRPILVWSLDSKKIATFQQDQRKVGEMYLVPVTNTHPKLRAWKYPLVGDTEVTMIERVVIDVDSPKVTRLRMQPDQHRSMLCDDISCGPDGAWEDVQWSDDGKQLAFVSTSRDHRQEWVRVADVATGDVREVMTETAPKFFEPGNGKSNWRWLWDTNEFLWFSERDGWGQMYLYDGATGRLKNQITKGEGNVTQMLLVDAGKRRIYFMAVGKEKGRDPYFRHYYSINFNSTGMKLLTPEDADHAIVASPDGKYFVDVASTPVQPQTTIVRSTDGSAVMDVAKEDIAKLKAAGWTPLTPITVKGRDGKTDLYGFLFKPTNFDAAKKYPIVNVVYPGPQTGSCGSRSFSASRRDMQPLAELGFIVVCIDGMGTPWRSKAFHEFYYGNLGDNTIPDQVAGMKDLAKKYPWIDLNKAGIWGHSGGGNATAAAMFNYPDFFKVGIAESGNHDQRDYEDDWAERWAGLEVKNSDGSSNYDSQANQNIAKNLKGKLMLAHGTMDNNVPPNNTLLLVDALIKANKDFDLVMIPNVPHGYQVGSPYMTRRRWDYFVTNLAGDKPPEQYRMKPWAEMQTLLGNGGPGDEDQ
jgi:dipeptidyl aminopeptidase/acylaminoacyl peptidase